MSAADSRFWSRHVRRELANRVRGLPNRPVMGGKVGDQLWNYLPHSCRISEEEWKERIKSQPTWLITYDDPMAPVWEIETRLAEPSLDSVDAFLFQREGGDILLTDHEGMGPWLVPAGARLRIKERGGRQPSLPPLTPWRGIPLSVAEIRRQKRWVRQALKRRGMILPPYPLASSGIAKDNWWNYIPWDYDVDYPSPILDKLFSEAEQVLAWSEVPEAGSALVSGKVAREEIERHADAYYLEWPSRRWLVAVPDLFTINPDDPEICISLVWLKSPPDSA